MAPGTVEAIIARATGEWEKISDFRFERSANPDVKIYFGVSSKETVGQRDRETGIERM